MFIFVSLSLGLLISSLVKKQLSALLISGMALMVPVIFLSGMMFPTESMPWILRTLSQLIPAKWYITAVKDVMIKGSGFFSVWREALVLSAMGIVFIGLSLKNFKVRLE
ncbi:MAG: ABC transporter permease [Bacteroidales bacterium]